MNLPELIRTFNLTEGDKVRIIDPGVAESQYSSGDVVTLQTTPRTAINTSGLGIQDKDMRKGISGWTGDSMEVELVERSAMSLPELIKKHGLIEGDKVQIVSAGVFADQYDEGDVVALSRGISMLGIPNKDVPGDVWKGNSAMIAVFREEVAEAVPDDGWRDLEIGEDLPDDCEARFIKGMTYQWRPLPEHLQPEPVVETKTLEAHVDMDSAGEIELFGFHTLQTDCYNAKLTMDFVDGKPDFSTARLEAA